MAAGVKEPRWLCFVPRQAFVLLVREEDTEDDDEDASLALRAIKASALLAASSRSPRNDCRKDDGGWGSVISSWPDNTMGVPSMLPQVVIGDWFPAPGMIWGVIETYDQRLDFEFGFCLFW
mmetsp:Transcript_101211/g.205377  ORF Transcript_101211/g.205377 Transcript_101211/m.205377 type:complete len:121 (+) Transcript_101211:459-821(+)